MKKLFIILASAAVMLLSCGSRSVERYEETEADAEQVDSLRDETAEEENYESDVLQQTEATETKGYGSTGSRRSYSSDVEEEEDNMRHFDPASEDDMDDNGMSRFMENNDDEGWD